MSTTRFIFWGGMGLLAIMGGVIALFWKQLPPEVPWLYSLPWGEKQLINKMWLVWIILGMGAFLFLTRVISHWAGKGDRTVQTTVMMGGVTAVILMVASFVKVMMIFLNI